MPEKHAWVTFDDGRVLCRSCAVEQHPAILGTWCPGPDATAFDVKGWNEVLALHPEAPPAEAPPADESEDHEELPWDIDDYEDDELAAELERRISFHRQGKCSYCGNARGSQPPCRFPTRHFIGPRDVVGRAVYLAVTLEGAVTTVHESESNARAAAGRGGHAVKFTVQP